MKFIGISIFYYINDDKLLSESDIDSLDNQMHSTIRSLINNGIYINNFQDSMTGTIQ